MRVTARFLLIGLVAFAIGCGDDKDGDPVSTSPPRDAATPPRDEPDQREERPQQAEEREGTTVVLADSQFGEMLYDASDQAIYVFELDGRDESACYEECAAAWPPVLTSGDPVAGQGVDGTLLGTTKRSDGKTQVTYAGRPLYYYAHEAPGEVRCHNVDLNGGLWWVVGRDGEPLA